MNLNGNLNSNIDDCAFTKPIVLIILDEYSAPDDLYASIQDSSVYEFSNFLKHNDWIVNNKFYSNEISTIHSLSSMFNFNISNEINFSERTVENLAHFNLLNSKLNDEFIKKNIDVVNFGIFDFGSTKPLTRLYYYPKSFFELFFANSIYHVVRIPLLNFFETNRDLSFYPMEEHNKYLFNKLPDTLSLIKSNKFFLYSHFYMPHNPILYRPEIQLLPNNFTNYLLFWNFTNSKIKDLIVELTKKNKYKIIITGDHGYKGDKRFNPNLTFSAFYGFNEEIPMFGGTVQDLGYLIVGCQ